MQNDWLAMDPSTQIEVLRRQYLQLLDPKDLAFPESSILKKSEIQARIFDSMFRSDGLNFVPPERYTIRVLKVLVEGLEAAIDDPEEDVRRSLIVSPL